MATIERAINSPRASQIRFIPVEPRRRRRSRGTRYARSFHSSLKSRLAVGLINIVVIIEFRRHDHGECRWLFMVALNRGHEGNLQEFKIIFLEFVGFLCIFFFLKFLDDKFRLILLWRVLLERLPCVWINFYGCFTVRPWR